MLCVAALLCFAWRLVRSKQTRDEATAKCYEFFASSYFRDIPPVPGARDALERLRRECQVDLVIVTSRQMDIVDATQQWLEQHYPGMFRTVKYVASHVPLNCSDELFLLSFFFFFFLVWRGCFFLNTRGPNKVSTCWPRGVFVFISSSDSVIIIPKRAMRGSLNRNPKCAPNWVPCV
jgi:hypothetical protein